MDTEARQLLSPRYHSKLEDHAVLETKSQECGAATDLYKKSRSCR